MNGAPLYKIFEGTPPTREEAPEGYLTSVCGNKFQRANALLFEGCVGVVLTQTQLVFKLKSKRVL